MTTPTAGELTLLREPSQQSKLYLSIYKPDTIFTARVNDGSVAKGERVVTYDGAVGDWNDVGVGMTLLVGTTAGGDEKGSVYIYGITATTITVGENSHINWADDDYLTVKNFYQIWPVYPRTVQDETDVTVYKAYDIAYTDENEVLGSLICMGPHHAGFLEGGQHQIYYTAEGTESVKGEGITYLWEFEGGTPTGSTAQIPGLVTYDTPGHYATKLVTTTAGGGVELGVRHVSIYDRPGEGTDLPIVDWTLQDLSGSRGESGYAARIQVREDISDILEEGALVVIFSDNWYGATRQNIGGNATNRESIFFVGYVLSGTIEFDYEKSVVSFEVGSPTEIMKVGEAFSVSVESSTNPVGDAANPDKGGDPWFYLLDLDVKRAIYHYMRWHSTINVCSDVKFSGSNPRIQFFESDRTSLYDALYSLMRATVYGSVVSDRQGTTYFETESAAIDDAASNINLNMFVDKHDWYGVPVIEERLIPPISSLEIGGLSYEGPASGTSVSLLSAAPGNVPAYRGSYLRLSGFGVTDQATLDTLTGNVFAYENSVYPNVTLKIVGNYSNFDIAPNELIRLTVEPEDTHLNIDWEQKPFDVRSVAWRYNAESSLLVPEITVAEITQGFAADTIAIPVEPPDDGQEDPPDDIPPPPVPPPVQFGRYVTMNFIIDGGGSAISTGIKGDLFTNFAGRIDGAYLLADQDGSIEVDIWVANYNNHPPTVANTIVASAPPTLSTEDSYRDLTLTGWTRYFAAESIFRFNVNSASTVTRVTLALKIWRS